MNNQFDKDNMIVNIKTGLILIAIVLITVLTCNRLTGQSTEVKQILSNLNWNIDSTNTVEYATKLPMWARTQYESSKGSDTTPVVFVLVKEDFLEEINGDTIHLIPYPTVEAIYGFHVQHWKPYKVEFFDSLWNLLNEAELLSIKKRKLFKK